MNLRKTVMKVKKSHTFVLLILEDSVKDFISYVNRSNISLESEVKLSIFERYSFLNENHPILIEYAAFFGSIQIFQYLVMNKVPLKSSL